MCNPRRVMIHVARAIEQAWHTTVEQAVRVDGEVTELARLRADIALDAEMGDQALAMLEALVAGEFAEYPAWQRDAEGHYRQDLGPVTLVLVPGSRQLIVEASLTEQLTAEVRATAEASGFTVGEVAVEAVGRYYEDGWGGRTEESARRAAAEQAETRLAAAIEALHRSQHSAELAAAEHAARSQAEQQAAAELERLSEQTRAGLCQRLQVILAEAEDQVHHTLNRLVGEAYRRTLLKLVHDNGGRVLTDQRSGSVINLEVELY